MSRLQSAAGRVPQRWSFGHWPLRRKLAAAIVLPVLLAFVFGGLRVKNDFDSSRQLSQAADTVLVIRPVVDYNLAVQRLAAAGERRRWRCHRRDHQVRVRRGRPPHRAQGRGRARTP